jgi:glycosyltransferase involved in cell wall biosynthesis
VDALLKEGMSIDLICLADDNAPKREKTGQLNVLRVPIRHRRGGIFSYAYNYTAFILVSAVILAVRAFRRRYDLVHVHNMPDILVLCSLIPKALGARVVLDLHDPMPELLTTIFGLHENSLGVGIMKWLEKWSIARATAVVTVNIACKRIFASRSCRLEKITVVMNAPDEKIFPFRAPRPPAAGNSGRRFVMMYHGSLVERNGLDLAVEALARVRSTIPAAELRIYGRSTPYLERVMEQVRRKGLEDCVSYLGQKPLEGLVGAIDDCDLGVVPNHRNAFTDINTPTRIFEYLALGKPVIAPRAVGICDYFDDSSLVFFELGDAKDLALKTEYVFSHPDEVFETVRRGQEVYQEHSWPTEKGRFIGLVAGLLGEGVPAATSPDRARYSAAVDVNSGKATREDDMDQRSSQLSYVLITPARNEGSFIEKTIESVIKQTVQPMKWVIVDDGSTDNTPEIVGRYLAQHSWIELLQMPQRRERTFAGKVHAFNAGFDRVRGLGYEIVGNLDADISFEKDHFEFLLRKFSEDCKLGVAGTVFSEEGYSSERDSFEGHTHVSGQCQLFRRQCWEEIGGYVPHRAGGIDWMAVTTARMKGWKTQSFRERSFFHHRHLGTAERSVLASLFSYGEKDYYLGGSPVWELFRVSYRLTKSPYFLGGLALGLGYLWAFLRRTPRPVSRELMVFHRKEQMAKLSTILTSLLRFRRVDNFNVARN